MSRVLKRHSSGVVQLNLVAGDELAHSFIDSRAHGGCEIERTLAFGHGHEDAVVGVCFEQLARQASGFAAEDESITWAEGGVEVAGGAAGFCRGLGGEEEHLAFLIFEPMARAIGTRSNGCIACPDGLRRRLDDNFLFDVVCPTCVVLDVEAGPVVKARAAAGFFGDVESERVNEVERAACSDTGPAYVASVVGDFGIKEDDLEHREA